VTTKYLLVWGLKRQLAGTLYKVYTNLFAVFIFVDNSDQYNFKWIHQSW